MGCGNSTFRSKGDDQLIASRIHPVHFLRKKCKNNNGIAMSKKVLLKDGKSELDHVEESNSMLVVVVDTDHNKNKIKTIVSMSSFSRNDDEDSPDNQDNQCFIYPGSPSFRGYFVQETQNDNEDDNGVEDVSHKNSPSHNSAEITPIAKFDERKEKKIIKEGQKGKSFDKVISKKKYVGVGVKNLLNVKSCYHLSCSGNDNRANLIAKKLN